MPETETGKLLPSELLRRGWCQGAFAMNAANQPTTWSNPKAVAWCFEGALLAATGATEITPLLTRASAIARRLGGFGAMVVWNDAPERTQAEVVALMEQVEKELGL